MNERTGIILLLSAAAILVFVFLVYSAVYRRELFLQIRIGLSYSWVVLLLLGALYGSFFAADLVLRFLLTLPGIPPGAAAHNGLGQTTLMGLILFYLVTGFIHLLPIPKLPLFYGNAAICIALLCLPADLILDITRMPVMLWALFFAVLGRFFKKSAAVYGCAFLYPAQALGALLNALRTSGSGGISGLSLPNRPAAFIGISLFLLPPMLLLMQGNALIGAAGREEKPRKNEAT